MKLEEKRRAIEAQKKKVVYTYITAYSENTNVYRFFLLLKVEAAFTRHRQRMGRTAFLNVVRRKGVNPGSSPSPGETETPSSESLPSSKTPGPSCTERAERCKPDGAAPKSPCEDGGGGSLEEAIHLQRV